MIVNLIVAYADKYVIGNDKNEIPWYYDEDLEHFKKITTSTQDNNDNSHHNNSLKKNIVKKNVVLMGYKTQQSLPHKYLKDRYNLVITTKEGLANDTEKNIVYVNSMGQAFEWCKGNELSIGQIFIIGGEQIYRYFMESYYVNYLDKVYVTRIHKTVEQDHKNGGDLKYFYGLGDSCYYTDIKKSDVYPEIEYRVLRFDSQFKNPESTFYVFLQEMLKYGKTIKNVTCPYEKSKVDIVQKNYLRLELQCLLYFPLFGNMKKKKDASICKILHSIQTQENIKLPVERIIEKIKHKRHYRMYMDLMDDENYLSTYHFVVYNEQLCLRVIQHRGNVVSNIPNNILFSAVLLFIIARYTGLTAAKIDYECIECYFAEKYSNLVEKMAWKEQGALPWLKISERENFTPWNADVGDFEFLGLEL